MDVNEIFPKLDLSPSEAKAYLAVLRVGEVKVSELGKLIGVTRMAGYTACESLIKKGMLAYTHTGKTKRVIAEDPEVLRIKIRDKQLQLEGEKAAIERIIPELKALYISTETKPKIRIYHGIDGLKTASEDILLTLKSNESYLAYGATRDNFIPLKEYFADFVPRRIKQNITLKGIVPEYPKHSRARDRARLREFRAVPKEKFPFNNEINIYGNKVSIISFRDKIGLVIESEQIAKTQKLIFDLAWDGAERYNKQL